MNAKKLVSVAMAIIIAVGCFAGCSATKEVEGTEPSGEEKFVIGFSNVNDLYPYCVKLRDCIKEAAEAEGMEVLIADASGDADTQNGQIDNFITQGADVVAAISVDIDGSMPAVIAAQNAGIPYVSFLTTVRDEGNYDSYIYIGSENYDAGLLQGKYLAEILPENAVILYQTDEPSHAQYSERKQGLLDGLKDREDLIITAEACTNNQKDQGISVMEDWMQVYEKIDCIVAQNDDSVLGAIEAMKAANRLENVVTVGLDGSDDALVSIKNGELSMLVLQDAEGQAKAAVEIFKKIRDGENPAEIEDVAVSFKTITEENIGEYID